MNFAEFKERMPADLDWYVFIGPHMSGALLSVAGSELGRPETADEAVAMAAGYVPPSEEEILKATLEKLEKRFGVRITVEKA